MCSSHVPSLNLFVIIPGQLISSTSEFIVNRAELFDVALLAFACTTTVSCSSHSSSCTSKRSSSSNLLSPTNTSEPNSGIMLISSTVTKMSCSILALRFTPHLQQEVYQFTCNHHPHDETWSPDIRINALSSEVKSNLDLLTFPVLMSICTILNWSAMHTLM